MGISTKESGDRGEDIATQFLVNNGFTIIERNFRKRFAEIDIIARKGDELVFCEVKRSNYSGESHPELRVDYKKQIKLARGASAYLAEHEIQFDSVRFDVITVKVHQGREVVEHIENAFWPPDGWDEP